MRVQLPILLIVAILTMIIGIRSTNQYAMVGLVFVSCLCIVIFIIEFVRILKEK